MNKTIKAIIGSALFATTFAVTDPQPAKASDAHIRLINTLERIGVKVYNGAGSEACKPQGNSILMGYYHSVQNYIVLCTNNANDETMKQTLVHEAVHAIQDCASGGIMTDTLTPIGNWRSLVNNLSNEHKNAIVKFYPENKWGLEVEARYLENNPVAVEEGVRRYCL